VGQAAEVKDKHNKTRNTKYNNQHNAQIFSPRHLPASRLR